MQVVAAPEVLSRPKKPFNIEGMDMELVWYKV